MLESPQIFSSFGEEESLPAAKKTKSFLTFWMEFASKGNVSYRKF